MGEIVTETAFRDFNVPTIPVTLSDDSPIWFSTRFPTGQTAYIISGYYNSKTKTVDIQLSIERLDA